MSGNRHKKATSGKRGSSSAHSNGTSLHNWPVQDYVEQDTLNVGDHTITSIAVKGLGLKEAKIRLIIPSRLRYLMNAFVHELVGSFFLYLFLLTAVVLTLGTPTAPLVVAIVYGLAFIGIRCAMGSYSTGLYALELTFAWWICTLMNKDMRGKSMLTNFRNKFIWNTIYALAYAVAQLAGSILAALTVNLIKGTGPLGISVANQALLASFNCVGFVIFATWLLTFMYLRFNADYRDNSFGLGSVAIGFYIAAAYAALSPMVGNPVSMLAFVSPGILAPSTAQWNLAWIWIVGGFIGALAGCIHYELVRNILQPENSFVFWILALAGPREQTMATHYVTSTKSKMNGEESKDVGYIRQ